MEGTHTVLQLYRPIMELCYVSFYLPKGKVRGFTYKGCVTLDKSNKRFHNCYQVREGSEAVGSRWQRSENTGDIFFKPTTTKDILSELYKLNAEKERLLASLLSSSHILGVKMGNQDGKLQEVSEKYKEGDKMSFKDQQESFLGSMEKSSTLRNKKPKKFSKRRESIEDFISKRMKKKNLAVLEPSALSSKEVLLGNDKWFSARCPADTSSGSFTYSYNERVEEKDISFSDVNKPFERSRREWNLLENQQALESDTDLSVSLSEYDNDVFGHCFAHSSHSLLDDVEDTLKGMKVQQSGTSSQETASQAFEAFEKTFASETVRSQSSEMGKSQPEVRGGSKEQNVQCQLQKVARASAEYDQISYATSIGSKESVFATASQENARQGYIQQCTGGQEHVIDESCNLAGAVNKTLLKVIQHDRLDDAAEWKRLPRITRADRSPPSLVYEKRLTGPQESSQHLSLNLPINLRPDVCQTWASVKQEDRRPQSPTLSMVSNVFNNSHPASKSHKHVSPLPSPLSSSLPSPQLHHRILPLPSPNTAEAPALGDLPSFWYPATNLPLVKDLEAQLHLKFSEIGLPMRHPGLHHCTGGERFHKSSPPEKGSLQLQDQWRSGQ
ncbi:formin-1-like [Tiliqua scincoides]|uniref:formin-1-like n=1 Tax=Tiliqua scincoides TaxID=71010 RepID=UPI0034619F8F